MLEPFLLRYLRGEASIEEIYNDIEHWSEMQEEYTFTSPPPLHDFLGLMPAEYQIFKENEWKFVRYLDHLKNVHS